MTLRLTWPAGRLRMAQATEARMTEARAARDFRLFAGLAHRVEKRGLSVPGEQLAGRVVCSVWRRDPHSIGSDQGTTLTHDRCGDPLRLSDRLGQCPPTQQGDQIGAVEAAPAPVVSAASAGATGRMPPSPSLKTSLAQTEPSTNHSTNPQIRGLKVLCGRGLRAKSRGQTTQAPEFARL